jgi:hypothetical protein
MRGNTFYLVNLWRIFGTGNFFPLISFCVNRISLCKSSVIFSICDISVQMLEKGG